MDRKQYSTILLGKTTETSEENLHGLILPSSLETEHKQALAARQPLDTHILPTHSKQVLSEVQYIDDLEHIIARDFFPPTTDKPEQPGSIADNRTVRARDLSLQSYLSQVTSEDNTSAENLLMREALIQRQKQWWMQEGVERNYVREQLGGVKSAVERPKNSLLFRSEDGTKVLHGALVERKDGINALVRRVDVEREAQRAHGGNSSKSISIGTSNSRTQSLSMVLDGGYTAPAARNSLNYRNSLNVAGLRDAFSSHHQYITPKVPAVSLPPGKIIKENTRFPVNYVLPGERPSLLSVPNPDTEALRTGFQSLAARYDVPFNTELPVVKSERLFKRENTNMVSVYNEDSDNDNVADTNAVVHLSPTIEPDTTTNNTATVTQPPRKKIKLGSVTLGDR